MLLSSTSPVIEMGKIRSKNLEHFQKNDENGKVLFYSKSRDRIPNKF